MPRRVPFLFRFPISSWARCVSWTRTVTGVTSSTIAASRTCWGRSTQTAGKNLIKTAQRWAGLANLCCIVHLCKGNEMKNDKQYNMVEAWIIVTNPNSCADFLCPTNANVDINVKNKFWAMILHTSVIIRITVYTLIHAKCICLIDPIIHKKLLTHWYLEKWFEQ